jgi:hypothetical protein
MNRHRIFTPLWWFLNYGFALLIDFLPASDENCGTAVLATGDPLAGHYWCVAD